MNWFIVSNMVWFKICQLKNSTFHAEKLNIPFTTIVYIYIYLISVLMQQLVSGWSTLTNKRFITPWSITVNPSTLLHVINMPYWCMILVTCVIKSTWKTMLTDRYMDRFMDKQTEGEKRICMIPEKCVKYSDCTTLCSKIWISLVLLSFLGSCFKWWSVTP